MSESHNKGFEVLQDELKLFSHDGLVQLAEDLRERVVIHGSWAGCALSYRRGAPGSARRDHLGRARNDFTILWDNGFISEDEVLQCVESELAQREKIPQVV